MHRRLDLGNDECSDAIEAAAETEMLRYFAQNDVSLVSLPKEPAIDCVEPSLSPGVRCSCGHRDGEIHRPATLQHSRDRFLPVAQKIHGKTRCQYRWNRDGAPTRQRIPEPLPNDEADIEQPMAQNRVGNGKRCGKHRHRRERDRR